MKGSLLIVSFFVLGLLLAHGGFLPQFMTIHDYSQYALYLLMLLVGLSVGHNKQLFGTLRRQPLRIAVVPIGTIVGTLFGSALIALFVTGITVTESMAIGSGMGYYSLSSILIAKAKGGELGTIALTANVVRELITLLSAPLLVRYFGKLAPIAAGGATTMDTTLPVITKFSGKEYVFISIFHGITTDFCVPFLVSFFISL